jgi:hypothetical protein
MNDCRLFFLRLCIFIMLCEVALAGSALAHDHLTGEIVSFDPEQRIIIVQPYYERKHKDNVTIHVPEMPQELETGMLVHVHGRYRKDDRSHFDATRVKIENKDLTGVRKRLQKIKTAYKNGQPEDIKMQESSP